MTPLWVSISPSMERVFHSALTECRLEAFPPVSPRALRPPQEGSAQLILNDGAALLRAHR